MIDRARLTGSASNRLEDVLRDAAGFQQFRRADSRSAHPTAQGATLRGLGGSASSRALVVLDGVPQTDPFGGWVSFAAFDPRRLGLVRVTRGGGSGAYGPGALAGTIDLQSAGPGDLPGLSAGLAYGSRDSVDADAGASGRLGGGFASISATYARGDGFIPIVAESRGPADVPARYEQASLATRAVIPVNGDTELQASGLMLLDRRTRGTVFTPNRNIGGDASLRLVGKGRWGWEALAYLQMRQFSSGFASVNAARTVATATLDQYAVPATGVGGRIEIRPPLGGGAELRLGADTRITSGETRELFSYVNARPTRGREAGGRNDTYGAFAETDPAADGQDHPDRRGADRSLAHHGRAAGGTPAERRRGDHQQSLCQPGGVGADRPGRHRLASGGGDHGARRGVSRLAAADPERAVPPVPRGGGRDAGEPAARSRTIEGGGCRARFSTRCRRCG